MNQSITIVTLLQLFITFMSVVILTRMFELGSNWYWKVIYIFIVIINFIVFIGIDNFIGPLSKL